MKDCSTREVAMNNRLITRREFCSAGAAVSALIFSGEFSLLAAKGKGKSAPSSLPYAIADYAGGIGKYIPLTGSEKRFVYRRYNWPVNKGGARSLSKLTVETAADRSVMTQLLDNGAGEIMMKLEVHGNSAGGIRGWNLDNSIDNPVGIPAEKLLVKESGTVDGASVRINRGKYTETVSHANPLFALWQLFALAPQLATKTKPAVIDLLDDGIVILPNQTIAFDGSVSFPDSTGKQMEYDSYALYGTGMEPVHFLYHQGAMPQMVTAFMRMYVLESAV